MKHLQRILLIFSAIALFWSCDRLSDNGPIDGYWQLTQVVNLADEQTTTYNTKADNSSLTVHLELAQFHLPVGTFTSTFDLKDNQLILTKLYRSTFEQDTLLTDADLKELEFYGITSDTPVFEITTLNNSALILKINQKELYFRRY